MGEEQTVGCSGPPECFNDKEEVDRPAWRGTAGMEAFPELDL